MELVQNLQKLEAYPRIKRDLKEFYKTTLMFSLGLAGLQIIAGGPIFVCLGYILLSIPGFYDVTPLAILFIPVTFLESQVSSPALSNNICFLLLSLLVGFGNTREYKFWALAGAKTCVFLFVLQNLDFSAIFVFLGLFYFLLQVEIYIRRDLKRFYKLGNKLSKYMGYFEANPGVVLLNEECKIVQSNQGIQEIIGEKQLNGRVFPKLLDENSEKRFRNLLRNGSAGNVVKSESVLKSGKTVFFQIKFIQQDQKLIFLVFCTDINDYTQFRTIISTEVNNTMQNLKTCKKQLQEVFQGEQVLRNEILINYREFHDSVQSLNLFLAHFSSKVDFKIETFNFITQLQLLIDTLYPKASYKGLQVSLLKGNGISPFVQADKSKYNLLISSLLQLLIEESQPSSVLNVKVQVIVRFTQKSTPKESIISFNFSFVPQYMLISQIENLFLVRQNSLTRKAMGKLYQDFMRHGIDFTVFDMVLTIMRGYVDNIHKKDGTYNTLAFSLILPFRGAKGFEETPFILFPSARMEIIDGVKWIPNREKDEYSQFQHQIKLIQEMNIITFGMVEVDPSIVEEIYS